MSNNKKYKVGDVATNIIVLLILIYVLSNANVFTFFADATACISRPATFFYDNDLKQFIFSGKYDNGDPKVIQYLLASWWHIAGRNMMTTHIFFIAATAGMLLQLKKFCWLSAKKITDTENGADLFSFAAFAVAISDPTVLSQSILMTTDVWLCFFGLLAMNSVLDSRKKQMCISMLLLCMTSRRGMICSAVIMIICHFTGNNNSETKKKNLVAMTPAVVYVICFVIFRLSHQGWIFTSPDNIWGGTGETASIGQLAKNICIYGFQNLEYGRFLLWLLLLTAVFIRKNATDLYKRLQTNWTLYVAMQIAIAMVTLPLSNMIGERYFTMSFIIFDVTATLCIINTARKELENISIKWQHCGLLFVCVGLFASNFIIYREKMAQSWDCSLAHTEFYNIRKKCMLWIEEQGIDKKNIASGMNISGPQNLIFVDNDSSEIKNEITSETRYYLYSNICNEDDEMIDYLSNSSKTLAIFSSQNTIEEPSVSEPSTEWKNNNIFIIVKELK